VDALWFDSEQSDDYWIARIAKDHFLQTLRSKVDDGSLITVHGHWTAGFPTRQTNFRIGSALVSPATAMALLRSIETAQQSYGFAFPFDNDERQEIDDPPYILSGWLSHISNDTRFDEKDPFRYGISSSKIVPGDSIVKILDLESDPMPGKEWRRRGNGRIAFRGIQWADMPDRDDDLGRRVQKSEGNWLQVHPEALAELLRQRTLDLIVGVHIERRLENEYGRAYERKTKKTKSIEKVFIFRSDGTIEDIKGSVGTWTKARQ
jgi:hypothetical protein